MKKSKFKMNDIIYLPNQNSIFLIKSIDIGYHGFVYYETIHMNNNLGNYAETYLLINKAIKLDNFDIRTKLEKFKQFLGINIYE